MNISYHPKYGHMALEAKDFIKEYGLQSLDINLIIGGDGSLFTYLSRDQPNLLICSRIFSKGFYASAWFEENYQDFLLKYEDNPEDFHMEIETIEVLINGRALPELAINDLVLGRDYNLKAGVNERIINTTGLLFYTPNGWSGWAEKFCAKEFETIGFVDMDSCESEEVKDFTEINALPYHGFDIIFDGKGSNLDNNFNPCTSDREIIYTSPWSAEPEDNIIIRSREPVILVQRK